MRLLLGIVSCRLHADRRDACRAAWMRSLAEHQAIVALFVIGSDTIDKPAVDGDTLYVPCNDDYAHLPQKTYWLARWAVQHRFDYLFKCDDDTFVRIDRLMAVFQEPAGWEYRGSVIEGGYASGGAGYLLSDHSMAHLADAAELASQTGYEDLLVGKRLAEVGIKPKHDPRFEPWGHQMPAVWNDLITGHYVQPSEMVHLHQSQFTGLPSHFEIIDGQTECGIAENAKEFQPLDVDGAAASARTCECSFSPTDSITTQGSTPVTIMAYTTLEITAMRAAGCVDCSRVDLYVDGANVGPLLNPGDVSSPRIVRCGLRRLDARMHPAPTAQKILWSIKPLRQQLHRPLPIPAMRFRRHRRNVNSGP